MIVLGRIVAPYGIRGWMKIRPFGDDPGTWGAMPRWWLSPKAEADAQWRPFELEAIRQHGAAWIGKLREVDDRNSAEALDGHFIAAPREALPDTDRNEYYWDDLIGLAVVSELGEALGRVESLLETGAHQVLVVKDGEVERLLPFVDQVVKAVDVPGRCIRVAWERDW